MTRIARPRQDQRRHCDGRDLLGRRQVGAGGTAEDRRETRAVGSTQTSLGSGASTLVVDQRIRDRRRVETRDQRCGTSGVDDVGHQPVAACLLGTGGPTGRRDHQDESLDALRFGQGRAQRRRRPEGCAGGDVAIDAEHRGEGELIPPHLRPVVRGQVVGEARDTVTPGVVAHEVERTSQSVVVHDVPLVLCGPAAREAVSPDHRAARAATLPRQADPSDVGDSLDGSGHVSHPGGCGSGAA